jgi:hypothetical protein
MKCLDEGTLQAYLDSELPEARMRRAAGHLEACAPCRDRLGRIEAAVGRVNAWLDALAPAGLPALDEAVPRIAARTGGLRWRWAAVALAGALAASVALFFANAPVARKETRMLKVEAPLANARGSVTSVHRIATVRKRTPRPKPRPALDDFVPFDDADPIQIGMVVRVMLPVSDASEIAADLVIGEDGRARAFRFVQ